ncbi:two-component system response regulator [Microseira wollei]|uniref:Diguanylate cyclase/phosphodiesterase with response regulator, putative n=1 Tax=Microseira wollei NIES-4236 TaxID=2530354 RepID=A0AAV3XII4_9CYAN|nr:EAL domain-containing protein [Microseira wollei]GET39252.1 diguanylate cyclase/phosphodiesterase with response regulator, putative [Microseira wollei NIES-4236]
MNQSPQKEPILIVDDTPNNLKVLSQALTDAGYTVAVAKSGETAIKQIEYKPPALILLDILMPGMDGFETCDCLKSNPATKDIPVIFMTALTDTVDKVRGLSLGAVDYITKPFQIEEVLARVKTHLEVRRLNITLERQNSRLKEEIDAHQKARAALQQLTEELEQRVQQRTAELSQALDELRKSQEKLEYDAFHDSLTGLPNRVWLIKRLKNLIEANLSYTVLFVDLDRFKVINDSLGHITGDELLKWVAVRMQACLKAPNTAIRMGGDEFVILLETGEATEVARQLLEQLSMPFNFNDYEVVIGASIGITSSKMGYQNPMDALRDADIAMYRSKQESNGGYQVFTPEMQASALARMQMEHDLRKGIGSEEFCLHYQPILSLKTRELKGFEALLRWNHPKGRISPAQFIPLAEETGLINPLGWWIVREACSQLQRWQTEFPDFPLSLNINFSPVQFNQANLFEKLAEILQETGVTQNCIRIEITESCLLNNPNLDLNLLKSMGLELCIDDFGTGYSSLSRLHELPIHTLKIDRSFVVQLTPEDRDTATIKIILMLAKNLGLEVVAEGIETEFQLEKLRELGCNWVQGYLLYKPLDPQAATEVIRSFYQKHFTR